MRATFVNKLVFAEQGREDSIRYMHHYRINVNITIRQEDNDNRDWTLHFAAGSKVPEAIRRGLARELAAYISRRMKKNLPALRYGDFVDMARAVNIL